MSRTAWHLLKLAWLSRCVSVRLRVGVCAVGAVPMMACGPGKPTVPGKSDAHFERTDETMKSLQQILADTWSTAPEDIRIQRPCPDEPPGVVVFEAIDGVPTNRGGRTLNGVFAEGRVISGPEAMTAIARAWDYGARRTVPAETLAIALGAVHDPHGSCSVISDELVLDAFKANATPTRAAAVHLPEEIEVDGVPGVRYVLQASSPRLPVAHVQALVHPDYRVELKVEPVPR